MRVGTGAIPCRVSVPMTDVSKGEPTAALTVNSGALWITLPFRCWFSPSEVASLSRSSVPPREASWLPNDDCVPLLPEHPIKIGAKFEKVYVGVTLKRPPPRR